MKSSNSFSNLFPTRTQRCTICNEMFTSEHVCNILGNKIMVADQGETKGGVAQVVFFDKKTNRHLLLYTDLERENVEIVDLYQENVKWELYDPLRKKVKLLKEHFLDVKNWRKYDIHQLGIEYIYTFQKECMYYVQKSSIPDAGNGAFAARRFKPDELLGYYDGKVIENMEHIKKSNYVMKVGKDYIDGYAAYHGLQYVNDARGNGRNNLTITRSGGIKVMSSAIPVGRELFMSYGDNYWAAHQSGSTTDNTIVSERLQTSEPTIVNGVRLSTRKPSATDITSIKTGNECGLWTIMFILDALYPEERKNMNSNLTPTWFVKFRAHLIWTLVERVTPPFVEVRNQKLYLDDIFIGPVIYEKRGNGDHSVVVAHGFFFDRVVPLHTSYGYTEINKQTIRSLQNGNMLNDVAIRAYVLLCLSTNKYKNGIIENTLILDSPMRTGNRYEYLKRVVVKAHRNRLRMEKFQKIVHVVNIDNWHWYVLEYDGGNIRMRNNLKTTRKGAQSGFKQFVEWYTNSFGMQCSVTSCDSHMSKRDMYCSAYHRLCISCANTWVQSNRSNKIINQKKKLGGSETHNLHLQLKCPYCNESMLAPQPTKGGCISQYIQTMEEEPIVSKTGSKKRKMVHNSSSSTAHTAEDINEGDTVSLSEEGESWWRKKIKHHGATNLSFTVMKINRYKIDGKQDGKIQYILKDTKFGKQQDVWDRSMLIKQQPLKAVQHVEDDKRENKLKKPRSDQWRRWMKHPGKKWNCSPRTKKKFPNWMMPSANAGSTTASSTVSPTAPTASVSPTASPTANHVYKVRSRSNTSFLKRTQPSSPSSSRTLSLPLKEKKTHSENFTWLVESVKSLQRIIQCHHPGISIPTTYKHPTTLVQAYHAWCNTKETVPKVMPKFGDKASVEIVPTTIHGCDFQGVVATHMCPVNSWLEYEAYPSTSSVLSDYSITVSGATYDVLKQGDKLLLRDGHYVNELPEDFMFQTMRLAIQMRYFPAYLHKNDVRIMVTNVQRYWSLLQHIFTDLYIPLRTFGDFHGPIRVKVSEDSYYRVIIGYTTSGESVIRNDYGDNLDFTVSNEGVNGKHGLVTLFTNKQGVQKMEDEPSPYRHGNIFLEALVAIAKQMGVVPMSHTIDSFGYAPISNHMTTLVKAMTPNCMFITYPLFSGKTVKDNIVVRVVVVRDIEPGEEWFLNYNYGSREERDSDGKEWNPSAWCFYDTRLGFHYNAETWVKMLVHPYVYQ